MVQVNHLIKYYCGESSLDHKQSNIQKILQWALSLKIQTDESQTIFEVISLWKSHRSIIGRYEEITWLYQIQKIITKEISADWVRNECAKRLDFGYDNPNDLI